MKKPVAFLTVLSLVFLVRCSPQPSDATGPESVLPPMAVEPAQEVNFDGVYSYEEPQATLRLKIDGTSWNLHTVVLGDESFDVGVVRGEELLGEYEGMQFRLGSIGEGYADISFAERTVRLEKKKLN